MIRFPNERSIICYAILQSNPKYQEVDGYRLLLSDECTTNSVYKERQFFDSRVYKYWWAGGTVTIDANS